MIITSKLFLISRNIKLKLYHWSENKSDLFVIKICFPSDMCFLVIGFFKVYFVEDGLMCISLNESWHCKLSLEFLTYTYGLSSDVTESSLQIQILTF